ncbi:aminotransferase class V-fold PLP-dependent enzyme [Sphingobium ummariense]|nr:aminotransferase class V-fold PLP-dependent enzyme [Sphingobium ummariense]
MQSSSSDISRRGLLGAAAAAGAALPLAARAAQAWPDIRGQFLLAPDLRYFNAANIGPAFRSAVAAHVRATQEFQANPSPQYREKYPVEADALRVRIGKRLGVTAQEIALVRNSSEANTVAVRGLALKEGDEVILTDHNHPSTMETWKLRAEREQLVLKILPVPVYAKSAQEVVDLFAAAITPRTRAIFLSHMSNVSGLIFPIAEIAKLTRPRGIWLHGDGAQSFGWLQLDLAALGVDSYSGSTHKWMMGPLEGGILYVRRESQPQLQPVMLSHGYWLTDPANLQTAQKYEILGQRDDPKLAAIAATLDAHEAIGEAEVERRTFSVAAAMRDMLLALPGAKLIGTTTPGLAGPVLTPTFPGKDVAAIRQMLWTKGRIVVAGSKADGQPTIRFSPHIYNGPDDIAAVADLLRSV